jgi:cell wall assembly regulator SMI1
MNIAFQDQGKSLSEKSLAAFEARLGARLPIDYREFLLSTNGGVPEVELTFTFVEDGKPSGTVVSRFFALAEESNLDTLDGKIETFIDSHRMPQWFLPVARDAFGNQICISLAQEDFGTIHFWNHEKEPDHPPEMGPFANTSLIAESFTAFWNKLEIREDDE